jgi:hypothetical protein
MEKSDGDILRETQISQFYSNYDATYDVFCKLVVYWQPTVNHKLNRRHQ